MVDGLFWAKVDKSGASGCWLWTGCLNAAGYGNLHRRGTTYLAHRFAYLGLVGPIPDGLQLDHLCRVRHCVNPEHLEPVTAKENQWRGENPAILIAKGGVCSNGHPFDEANSYFYEGDGYVNRRCRKCVAAAQRRYKARRQMAER